MLALAIAISALLVGLHLWRHRWWPQLRERPWVRARLPRSWRADSGARRLQLGQLVESATRKLERAVQPHPSRATSLGSGADLDAALEQLQRPGSGRRAAPSRSGSGQSLGAK